MANTVLLRTVNDGSHTVIVHGYIASDGSSGDLSDQVVIDVSALSPAATKLVIEKVEGHFSGCSGTLEFDATTDVPFLTFPAGEQVCIDFKKLCGGLSDNAGSGTTGDILLTTSGFTASGDVGWFIIVARKVGSQI